MSIPHHLNPVVTCGAEPDKHADIFVHSIDNQRPGFAAASGRLWHTSSWLNETCAGVQRIQELQAKQPTKPRGAVTILAFQATCGEDCTRGNKHDQSWNIANMAAALDEHFFEHEHKHIDFYNVSWECSAEEIAAESCAAAEIFISASAPRAEAERDEAAVTTLETSTNTSDGQPPRDTSDGGAVRVTAGQSSATGAAGGRMTLRGGDGVSTHSGNGGDGQFTNSRERGAGTRQARCLTCLVFGLVAFVH